VACRSLSFTSLSRSVVAFNDSTDREGASRSISRPSILGSLQRRRVGFVLACAMVSMACERATTPDQTGTTAPLALELRIGEVEGDSALTRVAALAVDERGTIYAGHSREGVVRIFSSDGGYLRAVGRSGQGPGEFQQILSLGLQGDSLWVVDDLNSRISFFSSMDGSFIGDERTSGLGVLVRGRTAAGSLLAVPREAAMSRAISSGTVGEVPLMLYVGSQVDTVTQIPVANSVWEISDPQQPGGIRTYRDQPFSDEDLVRWNPQGTEVVRVVRRGSAGVAPHVFRVIRTNVTGDTLFVGDFPYDPIPIDPSAVDLLVEQVAQEMARVPLPGVPTADRAATLARSTLFSPAFHPPVSDAVLGKDGTVWLRREESGQSTVQWNVLSGAGELLATTQTPMALRAMAVDACRVWGVETDELDVPYIVRYRLEGSGPRSC
jgi:hypothetical protein